MTFPTHRNADQVAAILDRGTLLGRNAARAGVVNSFDSRKFVKSQNTAQYAPWKTNAARSQIVVHRRYRPEISNHSAQICIAVILKIVGGHDDQYPIVRTNPVAQRAFPIGVAVGSADAALTDVRFGANT